jgi:protein-disulfide isomerase
VPHLDDAMTMMRRVLIDAMILLTMSISTAGAQTTAGDLAPSVQQRVETLVRSKADLPPATTLSFKMGGPSDLPGFDKLSAHFASALTGASGNISFLISKDGSHLAQLSTYDISGNPRAKVASEGRPSRGGPPDAPVLVVVFDDLECPYCAQLNKQLYPALASRYTKGQVRVVYQNVPIEGHPWAMRAAVDTDCLGQMNPDAYWAAVDGIHEHAAEYGGTERKLSLAEQQIDAETLEDGRRFHVEEEKLQACIKRQDPTPEKSSIELGETLGVTHTPTVFVNGAKSEGIVPMDFIFDMVDNALKAEGQIPPPRKPTSE